MATSFTARGSQTMNSIFFKPILRKSIHKKSASHDIIRDATKTEAAAADEASHKGLATGADVGGNDPTTSWVPHPRSGIYYPRGHENVLQDVPLGSAADTEAVNWFS